LKINLEEMKISHTYSNNAWIQANGKEISLNDMSTQQIEDALDKLLNGSLTLSSEIEEETWIEKFTKELYDRD
jgi:hypothetical protein